MERSTALTRARRGGGWLCLFAALLAGAASGAGAERRVALLIGNSRYADAPLLNPANDARLLGDALREAGFDVEVRTDLDQKGMKRAILELGERLEAAGTEGVGLFYYAGHGVQVNGQNYLVPVDAAIAHERDVSVESVPASDVTDMLGFARARVMIVILDACRNNPFARSFRSGVRGLAKMEAPSGTLIAYATAPGDVALDGEGANSPYSEALSRAIRRPGVPIELAFKATRVSVQEKTGKRQTPWEHSSLTGDFYFTPPAAAAAEASAAPAASLARAEPGPGAPARAPVQGDHEIVFWESVQQSSRPEEYEAFLRRFPDGSFAELARLRLSELRAGASGASPSRRRIAFSQELDVEIFAEYTEPDWCTEALRLRFEAGDTAVFRDAQFPGLVAKLSKVLERECPRARDAEIRGYGRGSNAAVYAETIRASEGWTLQR